MMRLSEEQEVSVNQVARSREDKSDMMGSCTFRSDLGADAFLELHSIVETAKKHDKTPYNAIQTLFKV